MKPASSSSPQAPPFSEIRRSRWKQPWAKRTLHFIRRAHLYLGLLLFPWAILYGFTGFLFNHPDFLADTARISFSREELRDTALADFPSVDSISQSLLVALNQNNATGVPWRAGSKPASFTDPVDFVLSVRNAQHSYFFVFDPTTKRGQIRENSSPSQNPNQRPEIAPFATRPRPSLVRPVDSQEAEQTARPDVDLQALLHDPLLVAAPVIMERKGLVKGDATLISAPRVRFSVMVDGEEWTASYDPMTHQVSGVKGTPPNKLTWRTFLLSLHLSSGYPGQVNHRWLWAVGVDALAIAVCFWGCSGLLMWWQIQATRAAGGVVLVCSTVAAVYLGIVMHGILG